MIYVRAISCVTIGVVILVAGCSSKLTDEDSNRPPIITSADTLYAVEDQFFSFVVSFVDPDGPDTAITFHDYPSWLSSDTDSIFGTPGEGVVDTGFMVIVSDGLLADSQEVSLMVEQVNDPPTILSADAGEATGGIYFAYRVTFSDHDGPADTIIFENYPSWLTADADSIFGIPPDVQDDTSFMVIVSDGLLSDSLLVTVDMIPCIVAFGDTRTGHQVHQSIVDSIRGRHPGTVFHTGDLVNNGNLTSDWNIFNSITEQLRAEAEFFPALGNHEYQSQLYFDNFDLPNNEQWYSVERNETHFIILNTNVATDSGSEQYQWLESELSEVAGSEKFIAAIFHHPPYSTGPHTEDEKGLRQTFVPLFEQYGVDIVFNGHDHDYERSFCGGIYYIVSGGGGAPLRDQARQHPCSDLFLKKYHYCKLSMISGILYIRIFDINNILIDQFEIVSRERRVLVNATSP